MVSGARHNQCNRENLTIKKVDEMQREMQRENLTDKFFMVRLAVCCLLWLAAACLLPGLVVSALYGQPGTVTIVETVYLPDRQTARGSISLRMNAACISPPDSSFVYGGTVNTVKLTSAGVFTVTLVPNDSCSPQTGYFATYNLTDSRGNAQPHANETWYVPAEPSITTIKAVRTGTLPAAPLTLSISQLVGASLGDIFYGKSNGTIGRLPGNQTTTKMYLRQTGSGVATSIPVWAPVIEGGANPGDCLETPDGQSIVSSGAPCGTGSGSSGSGGGSSIGDPTAAYSTNFAASTNWSILGTSHGFGTCDLVEATYSNSGSTLALVEARSMTCNQSTFNIDISWDSPQAGRLALLKASGTGSYAVNRTGDSWTIAGSLHGLGSCDLVWSTYDISGAVYTRVRPDSFSCNTSTYDITVSWSGSHTGRIALVKTTTTLGSYTAAGSGSTWSVTNAEHGLNACDIVPLIYSVSGGVASVTEPDSYSCGLSDYTVTVNWSGSTTGRLVLVKALGNTGSRSMTLFSGVLNYGSIASGNCAELTIAVAAAMVGDAIAASWPTTLESGLLGNMVIIGPGEVTVRLCNITASPIDPVPQAFGGVVVSQF